MTGFTPLTRGLWIAAFLSLDVLIVSAESQAAAPGASEQMSQQHAWLSALQALNPYLLALAAGLVGMALLQRLLNRGVRSQMTSPLKHSAAEINTQPDPMSRRRQQPGELPGVLSRLPRAFNPFLLRRAGQAPTKDHPAAGPQDFDQNQHLVRQVLDLTPSPLALVNVQQGRFVYANRKMAAFFGIPAGEVSRLGESYLKGSIHPEDLPLYARLNKDLDDAGMNAIGENAVVETGLRLRNRRGEWRWMNFRSVVVERTPNHQPLLVLHICDDNTDERFAQDQLIYNSTHDGLTGLYNWAYFNDSIDKMRRGGFFPVAVMMMDVDNLKVINDSNGHNTGDELLRRIGGVMMSAFREGDIVARVGGDEFAALLPGVDEHTAQAIIGRVRTRLREATQVSNVPLDIISIGVSIADNAQGLERARRIADQRMYEEKQKRKERE